MAEKTDCSTEYSASITHDESLYHLCRIIVGKQNIKGLKCEHMEAFIFTATGFYRRSKVVMGVPIMFYLNMLKCNDGQPPHRQSAKTFLRCPVL